MTLQKTSWCDLPNAGRIDWVIESMAQYPEIWVAENDAFMARAQNSRLWMRALEIDNYPGRQPAWEGAVERVRMIMRGATVRGEICDGSVSAGTWCAIFALAVYDDHGGLVEADLWTVGLLAGLGHAPAQLLLAASGVHSRIRGLRLLAG